jgi:hypothetical protein
MMRLFFLLFVSAAFSQQISRFDNALIWRDSLLLFSSDSIYSSPISPSRSFSFSSLPLKPNKDLPVLKSIITPLDSQIYFLDGMGGGVFEFQKDSLTRIDKSYKHRMQIDATVFVKNDTVFKYGGYGFWSVRNFITFFDPNSKEWEILPAQNSDIIPDGTIASMYAISSDEIIFLGGEKLNVFDQQDFSPANEIWKFNFKDKLWTFLGNSTLNFSDFKAHVQMGEEILFLDDTDLILINPFTNKVAKFNNTTLHKKIITTKNLMPLYSNYQFVSFVNSSITGAIGIEVRGRDEFFGPLVETSKLYNDFNYFWLLLVLPFGFAIAMGVKKYKHYRSRANSITVKKGGLIYKRIYYSLTIQENGILLCLLGSEGVETSSIMQFVENPNHNYSHNMRTKNKIIGELNYKLKTILKIEKDLILAAKSDKDKRIIIYTIDKTFFSY